MTVKTVTIGKASKACNDNENGNHVKHVNVGDDSKDSNHRQSQKKHVANGSKDGKDM